MSYVLTMPAQRSLGYLGASCKPPSTAVQVGKSAGISAAAAAASFVPVVGPVLGPVVGLIGSLFGQSDHSKCAHGQPDRLSYLTCAGKNAKNVPADQSVDWDLSRCGWYKWCACPGAVGGVPPAGGCGPCCDGDAVTHVGSCCSDTTCSKTAAGGALSSVQGLLTKQIGGMPAWVLGLGALLLLVLYMRS